ncbi:MAG: class I SAM-dependent methyltransferase [Gaiellaceae bacterium]
MSERWWHTIEFPDGTVTDASWDFRPLTRQLPWPDVRGKRCLDVGTADGFWAFELERRGAAEVVAIDRPSYFQSKARARFEVAHGKLGSRVRYEEGDVHELEGEFDFAFMGYVLQVVTDPLGALERARRVSRELLVLDTVSLPLSFLPSPLARLDARRDGGEWFVFNPRGLRKAVELAGWTVLAQTGILADKRDLDWKHRVGLRGRACAILGRA